MSNLGASGLSVSLLLRALLLKLGLLIDLNFLIFFHQTCIKKLSSRQWKNFSFLVEKLWEKYDLVLKSYTQNPCTCQIKIFCLWLPPKKLANIYLWILRTFSVNKLDTQRVWLFQYNPVSKEKALWDKCCISHVMWLWVTIRIIDL